MRQGLQDGLSHLQVKAHGLNIGKTKQVVKLLVVVLQIVIQQALLLERMFRKFLEATNSI